MYFTEIIQNIITAASDQLIAWAAHMLPQVFLFLIFMNAVMRLVGRARVERLAMRCGSNSLLRYMILPFLSAVILGNPMAISMGRYLPEKYKPAYFASVSYHCHTNSGIFQHINPAELFLWIGIADGILSLHLKVFPLALRYMCAGLIANFVSGQVTEFITLRLAEKKHIALSSVVDLNAGSDASEDEIGQIPPYDRSTEYERNGTVHPSGEPAGQKSEEPGSRFCSITITRGDGGYGGPITVTPTEERHVVLYMTSGGVRPEPLDRILSLSGMTAVNGTLEVCPDEKVALAIIDCGGTLRCGIYPGKGIPTVNILDTGRSGPLAKYMTEDLYVSGVTSAEIAPAVPETEANDNEIHQAESLGNETHRNEISGDEAYGSEIHRTEAHGPENHGTADENFSHPSAPDSVSRILKILNTLLVPVSAVNRIVHVFYQSARDAVGTCLNMLLPFMGFAALFIGICRGSGLTQFLAGLLRPIEGSLPGLFLTGIICSIPGLSAILGAGAVAAQIFATMVGSLISQGTIAPVLALPALFAINCQCACDFIPVGLGMMEAKTETVQLGTTAVTMSRFLTGWLRIVIALIFCIGLYA